MTMRKTNAAYWRRIVSLSDDERHRLRALGGSISEIAKRMQMNTRTIEELLSIGGVVMKPTLEKARARLEELSQ